MSKKAQQAIRQQVSRAHPFVSCGLCSNGWVESSWGSGVTKAFAAKRCSCFRVHQAKVEQLVAEETGRQVDGDVKA